MQSVRSDDWPQDGPESSGPLISFVIPIYNAGRYLPKCLEAITQQTFRDIEIIAVDGGSDDGSGRILDERQQAEPRLKVLHEGRIGPGTARNVGARHATGEYLWFVDGDDVVSRECLPGIADSLKVAAPDVLLMDHEIVWRRRRPQPGAEHDLLSRETATCFTVAEQPWVLDLSMASWNKVIRREYFFSVGTAFSPEWPHEDVLVSCLLLLEAGRLSTLNQFCYQYRKNRVGSVMKTGERRRHFKIFDAWRPALDAAQIRIKSDDPLITKEVYCTLFKRAIWHYSTILDTGGFGIGRFGISGYVARGDRGEFFDEMHSDFARYAPADYRSGDGFRRLKFRLIERDSYRAYSILDPVNKVRMCVIRASRVVRRGFGRRPG